MNIYKSFKSQIGSLVNRDVWNSDLPKIEATKETKEFVVKHPNRVRGSVRIRRGLFYLNGELDSLRSKIKLP